MNSWILVIVIMSTTTQTGNSVATERFASGLSCKAAAEAIQKRLWDVKVSQSLSGYPIVSCYEDKVMK